MWTGPLDFKKTRSCALFVVFALLTWPASGQAPGDVDRSFDAGAGVDDAILAITVQEDGKVLIGGEFTALGNRISRLNPDGSVDGTFDAGAGADDSVSAIVVQADGKVLIGGEFTRVGGLERNRIARLHPDGQVDPTFASGTGANGWIRSIVVQPDGKILVGGGFTKFDGNDHNRIVRLEPDGSVDASFNPGTGPDGEVRSMALQPDGKVLIGGAFNRVNGQNLRRVARLNSDGSVDDSFDPGTGPDNSVSSVVLQPDGRVLIGGSFARVNGIDRNRIARLEADGSLDASFDPGTGASQPVFSMALQADGKVLIGGAFMWVGGVRRDEIARLNADGTVDLDFDAGPPPAGMVRRIQAVVVQDDGLILAGRDYRLDRFNPDGTLDGNFRADRGPNQSVLSLALQPDGKVLIAGLFSRAGGDVRNQIARLHADGSLDAEFAPETPVNNINWIRVLVLQADGKILFAGSTVSVVPPAHRVARLNPDGSVDSSFDFGTGANGLINSVALQPDGKVVIGGSFSRVNGVERSRIARLHSDGSLDDTFHPGTGPNSGVSSLALQPDGGILIGGGFSSVDGVTRSGMARLKADGTVDEDFNAPMDSGASVGPIAIQKDGKILFAGQLTADGVHRIARLNPDGTWDEEFDPGTGTDERVMALAVDPDGRVLIGGDFGAVDGVARSRIARLNPDGSLDHSFDPGTGADRRVASVVVQPDGRVLVGGEFRVFNGLARWSVARLHGAATIEPLTLGAPEMLPDGRFRWLLSAANGRTYIVQASSDLADWSDLAIFGPEDTLFEFTDADAVSFPQRFYRVKTEAP